MARCTISSSSISSPHRAKRLNAAIVHATRAWKEAHTRWPIFLLWKTGGEQRQHGCHQHARVPSATRPDFHGGGGTGLRMEPGIGQDNPPAITLGKQRVQRRIMDIG